MILFPFYICGYLMLRSLNDGFLFEPKIVFHGVFLSDSSNLK